MSIEMKQKYKVISLFSGGMGLDLGLDSTDRYEIVACVEKERVFCDTIRKNIAAGRINPKLQVFEGDISSLDPLEVLKAVGLEPGEVDLLVGGPPCQSFSTAGKRGTVQDPRGTLLWQFLRFVEHIQPKFFLMENVRGLISAALIHRPISERPENGGPPLSGDEKPGSVVRRFSEDLQAIPGAAYHLDVFEVNSVNYGAPQIRERVIFIGNRYNEQVDFPNPTHGPIALVKPQADLFQSVSIKPWATLRDAIGDLKEINPVVLDFSPRKKSFLSRIPQGANWRSLPIELQQESMGKAWHAKGGRSGWWRRLTFDLPCPTLVTMPNHASTSLCHPIETRALSLLEYARIQEFPDKWEFSGTVSEKYRQVGNAVPTRLGRVAGHVIAKYLDEAKSRDWRKLDVIPDAFRIVYIQSHVRTRQWFKDGKTIVWENGGEDDEATYSPSRTKRKSRKIA
jgi:DNA (cytosine-5)-methyltransferase 1